MYAGRRESSERFAVRHITERQEKQIDVDRVHLGQESVLVTRGKNKTGGGSSSFINVAGFLPE